MCPLWLAAVAISTYNQYCCILSLLEVCLLWCECVVPAAAAGGATVPAGGQRSLAEENDRLRRELDEMKRMMMMERKWGRHRLIAGGRGVIGCIVGRSEFPSFVLPRGVGGRIWNRVGSAVHRVQVRCGNAVLYRSEAIWISVFRVFKSVYGYQGEKCGSPTHGIQHFLCSVTPQLLLCSATDVRQLWRRL